MKKVEILNPIVDKINYWLEYEKNKPKVPYQGNKKFTMNIENEMIWIAN